jgi:hypothetical protein
MLRLARAGAAYIFKLCLIQKKEYIEAATIPPNISLPTNNAVTCARSRTGRALRAQCRRNKNTDDVLAHLHYCGDGRLSR